MTKTPNNKKLPECTCDINPETARDIGHRLDCARVAEKTWWQERKTPNNSPEDGAWKDMELDDIWHNGIKAMFEGKIDRYELLSFVEIRIEKLLQKSRQEAYEEGRKDELKSYVEMIDTETAKELQSSSKFEFARKEIEKNAITFVLEGILEKGHGGGNWKRLIHSLMPPRNKKEI